MLFRSHWHPALGRLELDVQCSAGTYIRSLARDLGQSLGCGAALAQLRRTAALGFDLTAAVSLERLAQAPPPPLLEPLAALGHLPQRRLLEEELVGWRCGRSLPQVPLGEGDGFLDQGSAEPSALPMVVLAPDGSLAGIALGDRAGQLRPRLVLDAAG